jgi:hypothetical protein
MLAGLYTEGRRRECANCGHFTSDYSWCAACEMTICDRCDHTCLDPDKEDE